MEQFPATCQHPAVPPPTLTSTHPPPHKVIPSFPLDENYIPEQVKNPLGVKLTDSNAYKFFNRVGSAVALFLPLFYLLLRPSSPAAPTFMRLLYSVCAEVLTSNVLSRRNSSLPVKVFVPVAYTLHRLSISYSLLYAPLQFRDLIAAAAATSFWAVNLFAFLLPVAVLRYMRAHFFNVVADEVQLKRQKDDTYNNI